MPADSQARARQRAASVLCRTLVHSVERPETILVHHDGYAQARPLVDQIARSYLSGAGVRVVDCWELAELAQVTGGIGVGETLAEPLGFVDEAMDLQAHLLVSAGKGTETVLLHALRASAVHRRPVVVVTVGNAGLPASLASAAAEAGVLCLSRTPDWLSGQTVVAGVQPEAIEESVGAGGEEAPPQAAESAGSTDESPVEDEWMEIKSGSRVIRVRKPRKPRRGSVQGGVPGGAADTGSATRPTPPSTPSPGMPPPSRPAAKGPARTDPDLAAKRMEQIERIRRQAGDG